MRRIVRTWPPAKLNLFLEILGRRPDGFHEIDTVMVPIGLRDHLIIERTASAEIELTIETSKSQKIWAKRFGDESHFVSFAQIPCDAKNLVVRVLQAYRERMGSHDGFRCQLFKSIPAGAGMGGASSDCASALICAAKLFEKENGNLSKQLPELDKIAASLGSDIPFFLGLPAENSDSSKGRLVSVARATGRGEVILPVSFDMPLNVVVVYPRIELSTADVYSRLQISDRLNSCDDFLEAFLSASRHFNEVPFFNRLTTPAREIAPKIGEILESMWRSGLETCQLTGSGSACFAIVDSHREAREAAGRLRETFGTQAMVWATHIQSVPARVFG